MHNNAENHAASNQSASAPERSGDIETATVDEPQGTTTRESTLPDFVRNGTRTDKLLFASFGLLALYSLALIPFRAKLLVDAPFLSIFLTGGNFSTLALAATNRTDPPFIGLVITIAALSAIKFLPLYFLMGKRWGSDFLTLAFGAHKPLWWRKLERFIYRFPGGALALAFIPFSPISAVIVTIAAGISKVKGFQFAVYALVYSLALKCFYAFLGLQFGTAVIATLQVIDRYMLWCTLALLVWVLFITYRKEYRARERKNTAD